MGFRTNKSSPHDVYFSQNDYTHFVIDNHHVELLRFIYEYHGFIDAIKAFRAVFKHGNNELISLQDSKEYIEMLRDDNKWTIIL